jgi:hypothetical protein
MHYEPSLDIENIQFPEDEESNASPLDSPDPAPASIADAALPPDRPFLH